MKKIEENLIKKLHNSNKIKVSYTHLEETISSSKKIYMLSAQRHYINFFDFMKRQFKYIGAPILGVQILLLFIIIIFSYKVLGDPVYLTYPIYLSISTIFIVMISLPFLHRSHKYKMNEIEIVTFASMSRLILYKLILVGIGDIIIISIIILLSAQQSKITLINILIYVWLPFLISCFGCMFINNHTKGKYSVYTNFIFCILLMVFVQNFFIKIQELSIIILTSTGVLLNIIFLVLLINECNKFILGSNFIATN